MPDDWYKSTVSWKSSTYLMPTHANVPLPYGWADGNRTKTLTTQDQDTDHSRPRH